MIHHQSHVPRPRIKKDFVVIDGATHGLGNCNGCTGGPYLNARKNMSDLMAKWMDTGFTPVTSLP